MNYTQFKLLMIISALALVGCTDSKKDAEISELKQQLEQVSERYKLAQETLEAEIELHRKLNEIFDPDGETVKMWNEIIESCDGMEDSKCDEVRESLAQLQSAISTHASLTLEAIQTSVDENQ